MKIKTGPHIGEKEIYWSAALLKLKEKIAETSLDAEGDAALLNLLLSANEELFEDQPNLNEWVDVLDRIDAALESAIECDSSLLLIKNSVNSSLSPKKEENKVPLVLACLKFTALLLENSTSKAVYNSTEHLLAFLTAADDLIVEWSLHCLACMGMPLDQHRQPRGETQSSYFPSLDVKAASKKLIILSQGWGVRGQGLGLIDCIRATDDSLPQHPGTLVFSFKQEKIEDDKTTAITKHIQKQNVHYSLLSISEEFFALIEEYNMPADQHFSLLARLRLARSFKNRESRRRAAARRILAIINLVLCHTCEESLASFLLGQPELVQELTDLVRARMVRQDGSRHMSLSGIVPHDICVLAIHTLSALAAVGNEDGGGGPRASQGAIARSANIFVELGIARGQYAGLLPSLIRNCVASLGNGLNDALLAENHELEDGKKVVDADLYLGLTFVQAAKGISIPMLQPSEVTHVDVNRIYLEHLERTEAIFGLVEVVVGTQGGAAALADCGLIPAMLRVLQLCDELKGKQKPQRPFQLNYIISQCIHVIEAASANHGSALTSFRELQGEKVLVTALHAEITGLLHEPDENIDVTDEGAAESKMDIIQDNFIKPPSPSQRAILFALLNELNSAMVHSQGVPHNLGSQQLCAGPLTEALLIILRNSEIFGGHLVALVAVLVYDIANSDPTCVSFVHSSGLGKAFLDIMAKPLSPTTELIMSIPSLIGALALTAEGVDIVNARFKELFPQLLFVFCKPEYMLPVSRCLHGDIAVMYGNGLDEVMRHVPSFKTPILESILYILRHIKQEGKEMKVENIFIQQYVKHVSQLLDPILTKSEHAASFIGLGGHVILIDLLPHILPDPHAFLANTCCISTLSTQNLTHFPVAHAFTNAVKAMGTNQGAHTMISIIASLKQGLLCLKRKIHDLKKCAEPFNFASESIPLPSYSPSQPESKGKTRDLMLALGIEDEDNCDDDVDAISDTELDDMTIDLQGILSNIPPLPLHLIQPDMPQFDHMQKLISAYTSVLTEIVFIDWHIGAMSIVLRTIHSQVGPDDVWSSTFLKGVGRRIVMCLSTFQYTANLEVCRVQGLLNKEIDESGDEQRFPQPAIFKLRIICADGAVVRTGIEIDACDQVHVLEAGSVVDAYERRISSGGVMRYRTRHGWISEHMRGGTQSPIAEVLDIQGIAEKGVPLQSPEDKEYIRKVRIRCMKEAGCAVLNRIQPSMCSLFSSLGKSMQGAGRSVLRDETAMGLNFQAFLAGQLLAQFISHSIQIALSVKVQDNTGELDGALMHESVCHYLSSAFELASSPLFDERRHTLNIFVLFILDDMDVLDLILKACECSLRMVLDSSQYKNNEPSGFAKESARLALTLLKRFASRQLILSSSMIRAMTPKKSRNRTEPLPFDADKFARSLHFRVTQALLPTWNSPMLYILPLKIIGNVLTTVCELIISLQMESDFEISLVQQDQEMSVRPALMRRSPWSFLGVRPQDVGIMSASGEFREVSARLQQALAMLGEPGGRMSALAASQPFEPSEAAITQLMDMGFTRNNVIHALRSAESNRIEVAMEHLLNNPMSLTEPTAPEPANPPAVDLDQIMSPSNDEEPSDTAEDESEHMPDEDAIEDVSRRLSLRSSSLLERLRSRVNQDNNDEAGSTGEQVADIDKNILQISCAEAEKSLKQLRNTAQNNCFLLVERTSQALASRDLPESESVASGLNSMVANFLNDLIHRAAERHRKRPGVDTAASELAEDQHKECIKQHCMLQKTLVKRAMCSSNEGFAGLLHLLLLLASSMPTTRAILIENGFIAYLITHVERTLSDIQFQFANANMAATSKWPPYLSSAFLLLDLLAQPILNGPTDLSKILSEGQEDQESTTESSETVKRNENNELVTKEKGAVPEMTCILSKMHMDALTQIASKIIIHSCGPSAPLYPLPGPFLMQGLLKLLSRLTRKYEYAAQFIQLGGALTFLSLPSSCVFEGHTTLSVAILRHLLEDSSTLQSAMEAEIRAVYGRVLKQRRGSVYPSPAHAREGIPLAPLMAALAPVAARDRSIFLVAAAQTLVARGDVSGSPGKQNVLLRPSGQTTTSFAHQNSTLLATPVNGTLLAKTATKSREKSRGKGRRREEEPIPKDLLINLIVSELLIRCTQNEDIRTRLGKDIQIGKVPETQMFFSVPDLLEMLAELVIAFPSCAIAIHRFGHRDKNHIQGPAGKKISEALTVLHSIRHAVSGCLSPPPTVVAFLLHIVLPLSRTAAVSETAGPEERRLCRKLFAHRGRIAQNAARLLIALCARVGEGRRRVLAELTRSLECVPDTTSVVTHLSDESAFWSLQAWGELVQGLAAPRALNVQLPDNASLSWEVVRVMTELGMVRALITAITRIDLLGSRSVPASAALVRPLEMITRQTVRDQLHTLSSLKIREDRLDKLTAVTNDMAPPLSTSMTPNAPVGSTQRPISRHSRRTPGPGEEIMHVDSVNMSFANDDAMLSEGFEPQSTGGGIDEMLSNSDLSEGMSVDESDESGSDSDEDEDESLGDAYNRLRGINSSSNDDESSEDDEDDDDIESSSTDDDDGCDHESEPSDSMNSMEEEEEEEDDIDIMQSDDDEDRDEEVEDDEDSHDEDEAGWNDEDESFSAFPNRRMIHDSERPNIGNFHYEVDNLEEDEDNEDDFNEENGIFTQDPFGLEQVGVAIDASGETRVLTVDDLFQDWGEGGGWRRGNSNISRIVRRYEPPVRPLRGAIDYTDVLARPALPPAPGLPRLGTTFRLFPSGPAISSTHQNAVPVTHPLLQGTPRRSTVAGERRPQRFLGTGGTDAGRNDHQIILDAIEENFGLGPMRGGGARLNAPGVRNTAGAVGMIPNEARWTDDGLPLDRSAITAGGQSLSTLLEQPVLECLEGVSTSELDHMFEGSTATSNPMTFSQILQTISNEGETAAASPARLSSEHRHASVGNAPPDSNATIASSEQSGVVTQAQTVDSVEISRSMVTDSESNAEMVDEVPLDLNGLQPSVLVNQGTEEHKETEVPVESHSSVSIDIAEEEESPAVRSELQCPPDVDAEVFALLPTEMQEELVRSHEQSLNAQAAGWDLEALAALPPDLREEVMSAELRRQRLEAESSSPADPSNALDMDNASFVASLSSDLRAEILMQADEELLNTLPPNLVAEARLLRERAPRMFEGSSSGNLRGRIEHDRMLDTGIPARPELTTESRTTGPTQGTGSQVEARQNQRGSSSHALDIVSKIHLEPERPEPFLPPAVMRAALAAFVRLIHLRSPIRPQRLLQRTLMNLCAGGSPTRLALTHALVALAASDRIRVRCALRHFLPVEVPEISTPTRNRRMARGGRITSKRSRAMDSVNSGPGNSEPESSDEDLGNDAGGNGGADDVGRFIIDETENASGFPPAGLIGGIQDVSSTAENIKYEVDPEVARRVLDILMYLAKNSNRIAYSILTDEIEAVKVDAETRGVVGMEVDNDESSSESTKGILLERLLSLLDRPLYTMSSVNLDQLLQVLEVLVGPLKSLPESRGSALENQYEDVSSESAASAVESVEVNNNPSETSVSNNMDVEAPIASQRPFRHFKNTHEYATIPKPTISPSRLRLLCAVLRLESCSDVTMARITNVLTCLSRVPSNRTPLLRELQRVAKLLGLSGAAGLDTLAARLQVQTADTSTTALTTGSSACEVKLLRVLQTLTALTGKDAALLEELLGTLNLEGLWESLSSCLQVASQLHGVPETEEADEIGGTLGEEGEGTGASRTAPESEIVGRTKQTSAMAGLLARFLPVIEAFFVVNARYASSDIPASPVPVDAEPLIDESVTLMEATPNSVLLQNQVSSTAGLFDNLPGARFRRNVPRNMRVSFEKEDIDGESPRRRVLGDFVCRHRALLNALLHQNPTLLDRSLGAMIQDPRCRQHLDFANKRAYFRAQLRKLRQHSTRRYGSLRLTVPRADVFEHSFHQLRIRTAEEMRGRLHITFDGEEGIDAGGLTREWYNILAHKIFDANYALFKSGADGVTFQPNPLSTINPDHLAYFKFVGRIVGKAIADGQLLDAHFTHSFYKHILGVPVKYTDMEAIDPTYYKNLSQMLNIPLDQLGLEDLTFSTESTNFGQQVTIDLIPNGRNIRVVDVNKLIYVQRIAHHRMTDAIRTQIEAFLEGFHELVPPELISIFTPAELELLISGMPNVDLDDLQANTEYSGYKPSDPQIQAFWNVLRSMTNEERALFLQFVTGTSKVPLEGFSRLQGMRGVQRFNIHRSYGGAHLLPSAHTCFNQLDLPEYQSEEQLRSRLLLAIKEGASGFGFA